MEEELVVRLEDNITLQEIYEAAAKQKLTVNQWMNRAVAMRLRRADFTTVTIEETEDFADTVYQEHKDFEEGYQTYNQYLSKLRQELDQKVRG